MQNNNIENIYGLIGHPLGHSFSKQFFENKFKHLQLLQHDFVLFDVENIEAYNNILAKYKNLKGLAVTIPYKEKILPYLIEVTKDAKEIGAVNCIKITAQKTVGYNTDVVGFKKSLLPLLQKHHTHAIILGTGGAAKAVEYVLKQLGIIYLLVSRNKNNDRSTILYSEINEKLLLKYTIIINCTPVGMHPYIDTYPNIPYHYLNSKHLLYDLVYKPELTIFLQKGKVQGCQIKNGLEMLILQAEENWKIWNS